MKTKQPITPDIQSLSEFLCFSVYSSNLAFGKIYKPVLEKFGLTYTQYITIVALWEEEPVTVSALGEKLFLESNTLTPILKKLEVAGFVTRRRDAEDERVVQVSLTKKGRALRESCPELDITEATGLSPEEFTQMQRAISKLRDSLNRSRA
ncbi:MarR family winged helix-turn-helix transcriptional regulator [Pseudomonas sp. SDO524_S393]|uniref:MarR family winged helix-turn-helix transcriptional regulator n=1 Tax=Pseudomonas tolaasii TaxID=29442 RepID=UPI0015A0C81B|nr:MarR family transcriptional regulator [Pseudomonas tolaasii]NVZ44261.1 MarR family transcriptional regulator [Pseudomonas tolaasii]NWA47122.1 MarR family transcriptional regulator [Pseudomonas tolaasii]